MTVAELITELSHFSPMTPVVVGHPHRVEVTYVSRNKVIPCFGTFRVGECSYALTSDEKPIDVCELKTQPVSRG